MDTNQSISTSPLILPLPPLWYLPSFYGDISLKTKGKDETEVTWDNLTQGEIKALESLLTHARAKEWKIEGDQQDTPIFVRKGNNGGPYRGHPGTGVITIHKRLVTIKNRLVKDLKPGRTMVDVVKFTSGEIIEHKVAVLPDAIKKPEKEGVLKRAAKKVAAGVSVAVPTTGCPVPRLAKPEFKARGVLNAFWTSEQREDFIKHNRFITWGIDSGHRYMVTSRHAKDHKGRDVHGQLFDLDDDNPLCVHDYTVPAAEEMLALHLLLQIPGYEGHMRQLVI